MDNELKQYLDSMKAELKSDIGRFETALAAVDAKIERVETALLTEFHK